MDDGSGGSAELLRIPDRASAAADSLRTFFRNAAAWDVQRKRDAQPEVTPEPRPPPPPLRRLETAGGPPPAAEAAAVVAAAASVVAARFSEPARPASIPTDASVGPATSLALAPKPTSEVPAGCSSEGTDVAPQPLAARSVSLSDSSRMPIESTPPIRRYIPPGFGAQPSAIGSRPSPRGAAGCLNGQVFVFTGVLSSLSRESAEDIVKTYGGSECYSLYYNQPTF